MPGIRKDKILILTGSYGEGHKQAAHAIGEAIWRENLQVDTIILDPSSISHPLFDSVSRHVFVKGVQKFPAAYHYFYEKTRNRNNASVILKGMNRIGVDKILKLLNDIQPTLIVSTCPIASGMISILKKSYFPNIPLVTVITDYSAHSYWVYPYTDLYLIGSEKVRDGLQELGVADSQIAVTGIPIDPKFSRHYDRADVRALKQKHGMKENIPVVLITGGGYGLFGGGTSVFQTLEKVSFEIQIVIVCGHNHRLYHQLERETEDSKHRIMLTGYVDYIEELMAVSDLMITKAGGLTVSEAIAMKLPMLLYPSIGGQEFDNMQFLLDTQTALLANSDQDLYNKLIQMLTDHNLLAILQNNAGQLQQKEAAFKAVQVMAELISDENKFRFASGV